MRAWVAPGLLGAAAFLAVALPLRQRLDFPRTGQRARLDGQAPQELWRSSLPWVGPAVPDPLCRSRWRGNQRFLGREELPAEALGERFRIVHACDFPFPGREEILRHFVDEMLDLRPAAVLATGDIAYDTSEAWLDFVASEFRRLEAHGVRVIAVPGNHERKGWAPWLRHFGPVGSFRADLGPLTVLSLDSAHGRNRLTPSQLRWLEAELEAAQGRPVLVQVHHPLFPPGSAQHGDGEGTGGRLGAYRDRLVALCQRHGVAAVLSGHWHQDAVFDATGTLRDDRADFPGPKFIVTTSLGDSTRRVTRWPHTYYGYRILDFEDGRLVRYTHPLPGLPQPAPMASTPLGTHLKAVAP